MARIDSHKSLRGNRSDEIDYIKERQKEDLERQKKLEERGIRKSQTDTAELSSRSESIKKHDRASEKRTKDDHKSREIEDRERLRAQERNVEKNVHVRQTKRKIDVKA
jgi:hypothetical protein